MGIPGYRSGSGTHRGPKPYLGSGWTKRRNDRGAHDRALRDVNTLGFPVAVGLLAQLLPQDAAGGAYPKDSYASHHEPLVTRHDSTLHP